MTTLDRFLPGWEHDERHAIVVRASPASVDRAVWAVTLAELPLARALFALRSVPRGLRGDARSSADPRRPARGKKLVLGLTGRRGRSGGAGKEHHGTPEEFLADGGSDSSKAVIDFRIDPRGEGASVLTTETRVHVVGPDASRRFARSWRVIRPFSGPVRILFLRAAKRRAEAQGSGTRR